MKVREELVGKKISYLAKWSIISKTIDFDRLFTAQMKRIFNFLIKKDVLKINLISNFENWLQKIEVAVFLRALKK